MNSDIASRLQEVVKTAATNHTPLKIVGGNSKSFYGRAIEGQPLNVAEHAGMLYYEPSELVFTARAGTRLAEIEAVLAEKRQWLPFEPPHFGEQATLGGTIACAFSGPVRPYTGAARDFILGIKCLTGKGDILQFGGQVMKNVAGYDVSRFLTGSLGTLAVLLEISCKVLPKPVEEITLVKPATLNEALEQMIQWGNQTVPLTATCFDGNMLYLRLSGVTVQSVKRKISAQQELSPSESSHFWTALREQQLPFFHNDKPLWRLSVPPTTPHLPLDGQWLVEWGGGLRWLYTNMPAAEIRQVVAQVGGHATLFRGGDRQGHVFHPLQTALDSLHRRLKSQFDPMGILNLGKMMPGW